MDKTPAPHPGCRVRLGTAQARIRYIYYVGKPLVQSGLLEAVSQTRRLCVRLRSARVFIRLICPLIPVLLGLGRLGSVVWCEL